MPKKHEKSQHEKKQPVVKMYPLLKMVIYQLDMVVFCFFLGGGGCYILSLVVGDSDHFFRSESLLGHLLLKPRRFSCTLKVFQKNHVAQIKSSFIQPYESLDPPKRGVDSDLLDLQAISDLRSRRIVYGRIHLKMFREKKSKGISWANMFNRNFPFRNHLWYILPIHIP